MSATESVFADALLSNSEGSMEPLRTRAQARRMFVDYQVEEQTLEAV